MTSSRKERKPFFLMNFDLGVENTITSEFEVDSQSQNASIPAPQAKVSNNKIFPHGNYPSYYGYVSINLKLTSSYRHKNYSGFDPRVYVLENAWFECKRCLDVGCNSGFLTIDVAIRFNVQSILGIDLDADLIQKAETNKKRLSKRPSD